MNTKPKRPQQKPQSNRQSRVESAASSNDPKQDILNSIGNIDKLSEYDIRELVNHASQFGPDLKRKKLETNQIRKFLDAINRVKAKSIRENIDEDIQELPSDIKDEIFLLKPKLAYAAARQSAALPLSEVMSAAIDKTRDFADFRRLVQLIESIIAYHKEAEGKKKW